MDFSEALKWLKNGDKATRNSWEPYGMYLTYRPSSNHLLLNTPGGTLVLWVAVSGDLLAEDWLIATADGTITWPDGTVA